jgi:RNA-splicing ligase RtcB
MEKNLIMEIKGKYCKDIKIFTDNIEEEALCLLYDIANHPTFEGSKIRIMPDVHAGMGVTIGFTCPLTNAVSPSHVGCDIGCSMSSIMFSTKLNSESYVDVEHKIRKAIPSGFELQHKRIFNMDDFLRFMNNEMKKARSAWPEMVYHINVTEKYIDDMLKRIGMDAKVFYKSIGTIGGGNHFIEYGEYDNGSAWTIHCGSRNFGVKVFKYWDKVANRPFNKSLLRDKITEIKKNITDKKLLPSLIEEIKNNLKNSHPNGYLLDEDMSSYITDVFFAQAYAKFNHKVICDLIIDIMCKFDMKTDGEIIYTTHNYISPRDHIIRKGAIASYEGDKMIIPFNMRDGLAICVGKSNDDWNCSAPHGAGRLMSRSKAKANVDIEEFKKSMEGIYSTSVGKGTLDESPMAYKDYKEILSLIEPTADVLFLIKPKINIKAFESCEDN